MFEINSYEPSPEAQDFNRTIGFVDDTAIAASKPAAKKLKTPELTPEQKQEKLTALTAIAETTLKTYKLSELREVAKGLLPRVNSYIKTDLLALLTEIRATELARLEAIAIESKQSEEARKERLKVKERSSTEDKARDIIKGLEAICNTPDAEDDRRINVCSYAAAQVALLNNYYAPTTVKGMLTEIGVYFREYLTNSEILRHSLELFIKTAWRVFAPVKEQINQQGKETVFLRVKDTETVKGFNLLNKAKSILENPNAGKYPLAAALALVTGRRSAEILSTAVFKEDPESTSDRPSVLFAGQIKGKGNNAAVRREAFKSIPVLVEPQLVIDGLERLGTQLERLDDPKKVNDKYAKALFREIVLWHIDAGTKITFKDLRAIYAAMCQKLYYQGTERGIAAYFSEILGHYEGDLTTAQSYMKYEIE